MWNSAEFFRRQGRRADSAASRYHDTAYNLEPNVKGSPGGLRDIQMIAGSRSGTSARRASMSSSRTSS
jgi:[protein-PII] uridylyltransferase